ncbi:MAG TPA: DNA replication/repair protein RecF [Pyrinomonadaceae bacterium]|jgi:DNA replication and repair protein RecF|nr:DNA replication/repair protein RecF [Pyrinomonadaceae bacterium]
MLLESLEAHNFRNLSGKVSWGPGLNIIYGDNGQGKTNWLEAIYVLATTKSFRTQRPHEAIRFGEDLAVVRGRVGRTREVHRDLQVTIQGKTKSISVNGKREAVTRYLGQLHAVAFTADELEIVRGMPDARRKFLDRGVVSLHPAYVQTLADYNRVIKQKNRLLQDASESEMSVEQMAEIIAPWNEQLISLSAEIHRARTDYVERLNRVLERRLFGRENITIRYVSSLEGKGDLSIYEALIAARLSLRLTAEISAGYSLIGPHRDDLEILFDGHDIRAFGSSGQQRSALIILDLAAISVYYSWHNEYPLFLIDDVDAELDRKRISYLLEYLEGRTQTFVTTSKESLVEQFVARANVYRISEGAVMGKGYETELISTSANAAESI